MMPTPERERLAKIMDEDASVSEHYETFLDASQLAACQMTASLDYRAIAAELRSSPREATTLPEAPTCFRRVGPAASEDYARLIAAAADAMCRAGKSFVSLHVEDANEVAAYLLGYSSFSAARSHVSDEDAKWELAKHIEQWAVGYFGNDPWKFEYDDIAHLANFVLARLALRSSRSSGEAPLKDTPVRSGEDATP